MVTREDEIMRASQDAGSLLGAAAVIDPTSDIPVALGRINTAAWASGPWTITLAPMSSGVGLSADLNQMLTTVRIRWGMGNAFTEAVIDYPVRGGSYCVHGAMVEVSAVRRPGPPWLTGLAGAPRVACFMSPSGAGKGIATYTEAAADYSVQTNVRRPAHAGAYRLICSSETLRQTSPRVMQMITDGLAQISVDATVGLPWWGQLLPAAPPAQQGGAIDADTWIPLHPQCTYVSVEDASAEVYSVQWRIDL